MTVITKPLQKLNTVASLLVMHHLKIIPEGLSLKSQ